MCLCLCPAKLVANISLTLTGDTTTQIMAPTVGGAFQKISQEFDQPPLSLLISGKYSLEVNCKMTICNTFHHYFSKPSLTPRLDLPNMAPARAIQLFIRIIDQIKVKFIFLAGSITILLQPLLNLVNWPHNDCNTT